MLYIIMTAFLRVKYLFSFKTEEHVVFIKRQCPFIRVERPLLGALQWKLK